MGSGLPSSPDLRGIIRRARVVTIVAASACALYLGSRFDLITLPMEGCSPVSAFEPGSKLMVDRWAPGLSSGDKVFVGEANGAVHLAVIADSGKAGSWIVVSDNDSCPSQFPPDEQPVSADQVLGRVILNFGR